MLDSVVESPAFGTSRRERVASSSTNSSPLFEPAQMWPAWSWARAWMDSGPLAAGSATGSKRSRSRSYRCSPCVVPIQRRPRRSSMIALMRFVATLVALPGIGFYSTMRWPS
jgi:hypothetical protein